MLVQIFNDPTMYAHLIDIAVPLILAALGYLSKLLVEYIKSRVHNIALQGMLIRLNDAVFTTVKAMNQTIADELKKATLDGKITDMERAAIKSAALNNLKSHLGLKGLNEVGEVLGLDEPKVTKLLGDKIEAAVADVKKNQ